MGRTLAFLALLGLAAPAVALACMNDKELPQHEREFRSQYRGPAGKARPARQDDYARGEMAARGRPIDDRLLIGGGAGLLVGAFGLIVSRARARG